MGRRAFLDDRMQAELEDVGYTVVRLLDPDEAAEGLRAIRALTPSDGFDATGAAGAPYHCTFLDPDREYKAAVDALTRSLFEERAGALLDRYRLLTSNLYVKAPGRGRFEVHQNWPVTDDIRDTTLTLWCPFVDVGTHNGTIQVVPRSHKILPDTYTVGAPKYFASFYDRLIESWLEPVDLRAGECILFDDSLLHWSDDNHSDEPRWSAQLVFLPEEKTPVVYHYVGSESDAHFELFEVDPSFFVECGVEQLLARPTGLPRVGTMPERNLDLDEDRFAELMAAGPATRALVYAGAPVDVAFAAALGTSAPVPTAAPGAAPPTRRRWRRRR